MQLQSDGANLVAYLTIEDMPKVRESLGIPNTHDWRRLEFEVVFEDRETIAALVCDYCKTRVAKTDDGKIWIEVKVSGSYLWQNMMPNCKKVMR